MWLFLLYSACHLNWTLNLWLDVWECFSAFYTAAILLSLGKITLPSNICCWEGCLRRLTADIWRWQLYCWSCAIVSGAQKRFLEGEEKPKAISVTNSDCKASEMKTGCFCWWCAKGKSFLPEASCETWRWSKGHLLTRASFCSCSRVALCVCRGWEPRGYALQVRGDVPLLGIGEALPAVLALGTLSPFTKNAKKVKWIQQRPAEMARGWERTT